jgi:hypothetical protein
VQGAILAYSSYSGNLQNIQKIQPLHFIYFAFCPQLFCIWIIFILKTIGVLDSQRL